MHRMLLLTLITVSIILHGCKRGTNSSAPATPTPVAHSISGKIITPRGPVADARVMLLSYPDEACAKLSEKQNRSEEEKKTLSECQKQLPEVKTDGSGEYKFPDVKAGWYRLDMGWRVALKSDLEDGADLTGPYRSYYRRVKDDRDKYGVVAVGHPFQFAAIGDMTDDLIYPKTREPYKSAKE